MRKEQRTVCSTGWCGFEKRWNRTRIPSHPHQLAIDRLPAPSHFFRYIGRRYRRNTVLGETASSPL